VLLYGTLTERLKAAFVLHLHLNNETQKAPGVLAPATLDALCIAAVSGFTCRRRTQTAGTS